MAIKWCGIDFGQCLMEPTGLRTRLVVGDVYKTIGEPEKAAGGVKRFREVVEAYGGHGPLKESHRDKIHSFVFEGNDEAMAVFGLKEKEYLSMGGGAEEAFAYMNQQGIEVNIVAELKKTLGKMGKDIISKFLIQKNIIHHFKYIYTPQGKIDLKTRDVDESYVGQTKESGKMYVKLAEELSARGILPEEMMMVGDKIHTDIDPARKMGINTVQYVGYTDMGPSNASHKVADFYQLKEVIKGFLNQ